MTIRERRFRLKENEMIRWSSKVVATFAAALATLLVWTGTASARPVTPLDGEGLISMTERVCGSAATWQDEAARNHLTAADRFWLYIGVTYDVQCAGGSVQSSPQLQAAAPPAAPVTWVSPLPGTCRPSSGGGQFGAPRAGYAHQGIDLGGIEGYAVGTHVLAAHAGTVVSRGYFGNAGNQLQVRDGSVLVKYNHLNGFAVGNGQHVAAGQLIGYMGQTGNATGPHLHVEVWVDGQLQNPTNILPVRC